MTNDILPLTAAVLGGGLLGLFFFGGLRWTMRKALASRAAGLWFAGSFLLRSAVCLLGFYWIGAGDPLRILVCLAGFIAMRIVVTKLTGDSAFAQDSGSNEARNAP